MDHLKSSELLKAKLNESAALKISLGTNEALLAQFDQMAERVIECYRAQGKVLFCGNGGSAADAQHLAAELSGRFYFDRKPLFAEALHVNTSYLTAVANDYSYDEIYARLIRAAGRKGDILIGLSTSGNSKNVIEALKAAKEQEMITFGFTGAGGGNMKALCDNLIEIPSTDTPRIQECHMLIGHTLCEKVEATLFRKTS